MILFNLNATAVFWGLSEGFSYELHFDAEDGYYEIKNDKFFETPTEAHKHCMEFCNKNGIVFTPDWSNLK
jgi:hypothetical protein